MPNRDLDSIKKDPSILRLYASRLRSLRRDGREYAARCPFHSDRNPSFKVYEHEGTLIWKCFPCDLAGNIFQFIAKFDKVPLEQAIETVAEFVGDKASQDEQTKKVDETFHSVDEEEQKKIYPMDQYASYERALEKSDAARQWLKARGIEYETAKGLHIGYRQDIGRLAGGANAAIAAKGWIALPCIQDGKVISIKYRSIVQKAFSRQPGMATALFNIGCIDPLDVLYVTEGEFDAAVLVQAGFRAISLPSASINLTPEMMDTILEASVVILAGDSDVPGLAAMEKLWSELQKASPAGLNQIFLLEWPDGIKDANDVFIKKCKGNREEFRKVVEERTEAAFAQPMKSIYSLPETMVKSTRVNLADNPARHHFPWPSVDKMAIIMPGTVVSVFATNTGMGKTTWLMNAVIPEAQRGECVLNYSAELSEDEYSDLVAAHILGKDRNTLTHEDKVEASEELVIRDEDGKTESKIKFYIGRNPDLSNAGEVLDLIEAAIRRFRPTIVILDHLHYICRNAKDTVKAQEDAMHRITNLTQKHKLKFFVIGQPRKATQQNRGKEVQISDGKGSETFTSDAGVVFVLHREVAKLIDPTHPPKEPYEPKTTISLKKGRSMGQGNSVAILDFRGDTATFWELTDQTPPPEIAAAERVAA